MKRLRHCWAFVLLLCLACAGGESGSGMADVNQGLPHKAVVIVTSSGEKIIQAEVAATPESRRIGLMNRQSLATDAGMLFIFDEDVSDPFWMSHTYTSLDILFIDANKHIVTIAANATILSEELLYATKPYRYALEVNAGFAKAHGIHVGDAVRF